VRVTRVSISLEKRANDGDYGSEKSEVEIFADLEPGDEPHTVLDWMMGTARMQVEHDLLQSPNLRVRQALIRKVRRCNHCSEPLADDETGYLHPACKLAEDAEREERYQAAKRRNEEQERQEDERDRVATRDGDDEDLPL